MPEQPLLASDPHAADLRRNLAEAKLSFHRLLHIIASWSGIEPPQSGRTYRLRVLLFQEGEHWIARILEYNLATAATHQHELPRELSRFLTVQVAGFYEAGVDPFINLPPSPECYHQHFDRSCRRETLYVYAPSDVLLEVALAWAN